MITKIMLFASKVVGIYEKTFGGIENHYREDFEKLQGPRSFSRFPGDEYENKELEAEWKNFRDARSQEDSCI
ncbi:hypothetical protein [Pseudomonas sp. WS 5079]|uniref:hypothetical protein n=1 Tax=Pseudomonas sp. WS 5079 TaxID=2717492 RepID=UPI0015556895|nr:hypothetical protein [Pseudomonas sp. WS 5079]NMX65414.1 hypothetical protein [Pseudomonas sp. WS 5079]